VAKRGVSYSWKTVAIEVTEEMITMGFIQTESVMPCTTAICQLQSTAAEVTSGTAPGGCCAVGAGNSSQKVRFTE